MKFMIGVALLTLFADPNGTVICADKPVIKIGESIGAPIIFEEVKEVTSLDLRIRYSTYFLTLTGSLPGDMPGATYSELRNVSHGFFYREAVISIKFDKPVTMKDATAVILKFKGRSVGSTTLVPGACKVNDTPLNGDPSVAITIKRY